MSNLNLATLMLAVTLAQIPILVLAKGESAENIFEMAKSYTVKIKSSVAQPFSGDSKGTVTGAGFVIDLERHWIVTNAHVVSRSKSLLRVSSFGKDYGTARAVFIDPYFDIAILEVPDVSNLKEAKLDCDLAPAIGTPVGAFGHPWDYSYSGTKGIISGRTSELGSFVGDYLQTDAPINPGNSGGPLISLVSGKIIGINTAGRTEAQNMNYAIPIEEVCKIAKLLKNGADPTPPEIPFAFFKDADNKNTLRVARVLAAGQSFDAKIGDMIVAAGKRHEIVLNEPQLLNTLRGEKEGAKIFVQRNGIELKLEAQLKTLPSVANRKAVSFSGIVIREEFNPEVLEVFGSGNSLRIEYVESGSLGDSRGVTSADILLSVNEVEVKSIEQIYQVLSAIKNKGELVSLRLKRVSFEQNHFFSFRDRAVPLEGLSWISMDEKN
jgi:S1-C subfamily serine protease